MTGLGSFQGCLIGQAVANSLGGPYEGFAPDEVRQAVKLDGDGLITAPDGFTSYRDDVKMVICVAESICDLGRLDRVHVMDRFVDWYESGDHRGIGVTAENAIRTYMVSHDVTTCGQRGTWAAGNGGAMRIPPVALYSALADRATFAARCAEITSLTHDNEEAIFGAAVIGQLIVRSASEVPPDLSFVMELATSANTPAFRDKLQLVISLLEWGTNRLEALAQIGTGGYVVETVCSAIYMALSAIPFREAITDCVLSGGDTDTVAGLVGAIVGAQHGLTAIPAAWAKSVEDAELLLDLSEELYELAAGPGCDS